MLLRLKRYALQKFVYCKFGNFRSFVRIKHSPIGEITLSFIDVGKSSRSCEFLTS